MTPSETKALTTKVNKELTQITDKFQVRVPLDDIFKIFTANGLDPKPIQNNLHPAENGRMHISVGSGVFFTMTWYKFSTGRFEIVAYVSSNHDDHKSGPIAKVMTSSDKRKAINVCNAELNKISLRKWKALGMVQGEVSDAIAKVGLDSEDFQDQMTFSTAGKKEGRIHVPVGNGIYLALTYHKMDVTGNYEIVAYLS